MATACLGLLPRPGAADYDDAEEEDHGHGDEPEVVVPEVLPAGARRDGGEG